MGLPEQIVKVCEEITKKTPGVIGFSRRLQKKIVGGKELDIEAIRFYVEEKVDEKHLKPDYILPKWIGGIPTDVVEVGRIRALGNDDDLEWKKEYAGVVEGQGVVRIDDFPLVVSGREINLVVRLKVVASGHFFVKFWKRFTEESAACLDSKSEILVTGQELVKEFRYLVGDEDSGNFYLEMYAVGRESVAEYVVESKIIKRCDAGYDSDAPSNWRYAFDAPKGAFTGYLAGGKMGKDCCDSYKLGSWNKPFKMRIKAVALTDGWVGKISLYVPEGISKTIVLREAKFSYGSDGVIEVDATPSKEETYYLLVELDNPSVDVIGKYLVLWSINENEKVDRHRPVKMGVSVGNWAITSGTLGWAYEKDGQIFYGSNAHVLCDDPTRVVPMEKRILQPGAYIAGRNEQNVVGEYYWHEPIVAIGAPSDCELSNFIIRVLNMLAKVFGRKTRFKTEVEVVNKQDFAVYKPLVPHVLEYLDEEFYKLEEPRKFVGHVFAGSESVGVICKVKYAIEKGFRPVQAIPYEPKEGDILWLSSMWCGGEVRVIDASARIQVAGYGGVLGGFAVFDDVIIVDNRNGQIKGGASGSAVWLVRTTS